MRSLVISSILLLAAFAYADEPIMATTQPSLTIPEIIEAANPPCKEWQRKTTGYSKLLTKAEKCGKQIRLHKWVCIPTQEIGWTPEVYELEQCK